jgi:hypothetical protein
MAKLVIFIVSRGYCMTRRILICSVYKFLKGEKSIVMFCPNFLIFVADNSLEREGLENPKQMEAGSFI